MKGMLLANEMNSEPKCLFLDNDHIKEMSGLCLTMHQPKKIGAVFKTPRVGTQLRSGPMWIPNEKVYKMIGSLCIVSEDGLHWEVPPPRDQNAKSSDS